jgi:hypothetical protein
MSINEFFLMIRYFRVFSLHFTYNKKQPPPFGTASTFWCIILSFLGLLFRHIPNSLSNYNVLTANAPFFYQISRTWSNHDKVTTSKINQATDLRAAAMEEASQYIPQSR